jgi:hypothetical protein
VRDWARHDMTRATEPSGLNVERLPDLRIGRQGTLEVAKMDTEAVAGRPD